MTFYLEVCIHRNLLIKHGFHFQKYCFVSAVTYTRSYIMYTLKSGQKSIHQEWGICSFSYSPYLQFIHIFNRYQLLTKYLLWEKLLWESKDTVPVLRLSGTWTQWIITERYILAFNSSHGNSDGTEHKDLGFKCATDSDRDVLLRCAHL